MTGMDFYSFLILLVIAVVVAGVAHYGVKYYVVGGTASFLSKVIVAWLGGWVGGPIFGYWCEAVSYQNVYIIPAILGSAAAVILCVDIAKTFGSR